MSWGARRTIHDFLEFQGQHCGLSGVKWWAAGVRSYEKERISKVHWCARRLEDLGLPGCWLLLNKDSVGISCAQSIKWTETFKSSLLEVSRLLLWGKVATLYPEHLFQESLQRVLTSCNYIVILNPAEAHIG